MNKIVLNILTVFFMLLFSCSSDPVITITGKAKQTKDGFLIEEHVLTFEEIKKYDPDYMKKDFDGLELQITGKIEEYEMEDLSDKGEVLQARTGNTKYFHHVESIEIINP